MNTKETYLATGGQSSAITSPFDLIRKVREDGSEYWSARDLMPILGYDRWENFSESIDRARAAASNVGQDVVLAFRDATKIKDSRNRHGGIQIPVADFHLTRYAAYLVAMNGDPRKPEIAAAQTYFAIKTREAELKTDLPKSLPEALRAYAAELEAKEALEMKMKALAPVVEFHDHVAGAVEAQVVNEVAKVLKTGEQRLWKFLQAQGIVMMEGRSWVPKQEYVERGYFRVVEKSYKHAKTGETHVYCRTLVTGKGLIWLQKKWSEKDAVEIGLQNK